jgi:hypothetical protein
MKNEIEQDIWEWIKDYIEVNNEFYDYKFPPCPYAKAARLKGLVDVVAYEGGNSYEFIETLTNDLINEKKYNVRIMVFPAIMRWNYLLHWRIRKLNINIIPQDFYLQYGKANDTNDKTSVLLKNKPYFIVIVNKLSDVLSGHQSLLKTDYYDQWTNKHYDEVVVRRQRFFEKHGKIK